jgi:hypothetical protein
MISLVLGLCGSLSILQRKLFGLAILAGLKTQI